MKKEIYCKFCGLELENNSCSCTKFLNSKCIEYDDERENIVCDTCGENIDDDSLFCPYCGVPVTIGKEDENLQKELRGEFARDVIEYYKKQKRAKKLKNKKNSSSYWKELFVLVSLLLILLLIAKFIYPMIVARIDNEKMSKLLENETETETETVIEETSTMAMETTVMPTIMMEQPKIEYRDMWIKQDGFFYCFDENGNPVVDDWVEEIDENGEKKYYYFDIDGRLVVNSWIDGDYYVGADGAMYVNCQTPDGAYVDENGKVIINDAVEVVKVPVERETYVYYEAPNELSETKPMAVQSSATSGILKGVDPNKTYELYLKKINQVRDSVKRDDLKCNIIYYYPVVAGANEKEVETINEEIKKMFDGTFKELLKGLVNRQVKLPKAVVLNTVEQRQVGEKRFMFLVYGKITPRDGLNEYLKYRFTYDRQSKQFVVAEIPYN